MTKKQKQKEEMIVACSKCNKEFSRVDVTLIKNKFICRACAIDSPPTDVKEKKDDREPVPGLTIENAADRLEGMLAICKHAKRSETTILDWIRTRDFPAGKFSGGHQWYSSKSSIDKWWDSKVGKDSL